MDFLCGNSLFFLFARYVLQDALGKEGEHQIGAEALFFRVSECPFCLS